MGSIWGSPHFGKLRYIYIYVQIDRYIETIIDVGTMFGGFVVSGVHGWSVYMGSCQPRGIM